jgi:hypothetical protein
MHGVRNLATQVGRNGLAVNDPRAHVRQPSSPEQALARRHNFLQRRNERWAITRNQKPLEATSRASDNSNIATGDAQRLCDQSD